MLSKETWSIVACFALGQLEGKILYGQPKDQRPCLVTISKGGYLDVNGDGMAEGEIRAIKIWDLATVVPGVGAAAYHGYGSIPPQPMNQPQPNVTPLKVKGVERSYEIHDSGEQPSASNFLRSRPPIPFSLVTSRESSQ